ncbi:hypothetical protein K502DRAFT_213910 [Neoconidiobolus thromboides FSU 785]|nr:hypothetical protein K502DRAFT_213910 [Neoconidiobolus thromboides FSU 785]
MSEPSPTSIYLSSVYYPNVSIISGIMALIVVLFMIVISIYDRKLVDRVSLRLQTGLSVYDIWLHGGALWKSISPAVPGIACTSRGYLALFFNILYAFLNVSIALNLQLIFIHNKTITRWVEVGYWVVPITLSLLISIPPLAMGLLGYSEYYGCYIADSEYGLYYGKMLDFYANQLWRFLCLIYLIIAVTMVFIKLRKSLNFFKNNLNTESTNSTQCINTIKLLGYRM